MDDDTLEILQYIHMAATVATFLFNIIRIREAILGEVLDMTPRKEHAVQLTCIE